MKRYCNSAVAQAIVFRHYKVFIHQQICWKFAGNFVPSIRQRKMSLRIFLKTAPPKDASTLNWYLSTPCSRIKCDTTAPYRKVKVFTVNAAHPSIHCFGGCRHTLLSTIRTLLLNIPTDGKRVPLQPFLLKISSTTPFTSSRVLLAQIQSLELVSHLISTVINYLICGITFIYAKN